MEDAARKEDPPEAPLSPKAARKEEDPPKAAPKAPRKETRKETRKVRTAPLAAPLEPPPPLDAAFFGDLFRTQRRLEQERRANRLSSLPFT